MQGIIGPPALGTLQPGDRLLRLNGLVLADSSVRTRLATDGWPRGTLVLEFERDGSERRATFPPTRLTPWERFRLSAYPIAVAVAAPLVAFLLVWRRPDLGTAWVFLWYATLDGLAVLHALFRYTLVDQRGAFAAYVQVYDALVLLYPASFVHFMSVFPRPRWHKGSRLRNPLFWLAVVSYALPIGLLIDYGSTANVPPVVLATYYPGARRHLRGHIRACHWHQNMRASRHVCCPPSRTRHSAPRPGPAGHPHAGVGYQLAAVHHRPA